MAGPRRLPRALGLAWDAAGVTVAEVVRPNGAAEVRKVERLPFAAGWQGLDPEARGKALRALLDAAGVAPGPVALALPRGAALWRRIVLPADVGADRLAVLELQARREFPLALEELHANAAVDADGRGATLAAVRRDVVAEWRRVCEAAGLPLAAVVPSAHAAAAGWLAAAGDGAACALLIDLGPRESELTAAAAGAVWLAHTAALGVGEAADGVAATEALADRLAAEVSRTARALAAKPGAPAVVRVVLGSGGDRLADALAHRCGLPVDDLATRDGLLRAAAAAGSGGWVAAGAALACVDPRLPALDLANPVLGRARGPRRRIGRTAILAAGAVTALAGLLAPGLVLDRREREITDTVRAAERLDKGEGAAVAKTAKRLATLRSWTVARDPWIDVALACAVAVPDTKDVYVASLQLREGQPVRIEGRARSEQAIEDFRDALERQPVLVDVRPRGRDKSKAERPKGERGEPHVWNFSLEARLAPAGGTP